MWLYLSGVTMICNWARMICKCSFLPGLCALSVNHSNSYLAYPGSFTAGEITLYDALNMVRTPLKLALMESEAYCNLKLSTLINCRIWWPWSRLTPVMWLLSHSVLQEPVWPVLLKKWVWCLLHDGLVEQLHFLYCDLIWYCDSQGTVIRVFSVPDGVKLFEFRRGMKRWVSWHTVR